MKIFTIQDLKNPQITLSNSGEYPEYLDNAVAALNLVVKKGLLTDKQAEERSGNFRKLKNAFEMMKAGQALMQEFGIEHNEINAPVSARDFLMPRMDFGRSNWSAKVKPVGVGEAPKTFSARHFDYETSLPDNIYIKRIEAELEALRKEQWETIKHLEPDSSERILYDRRFARGKVAESLDYYQPNIEAIKALPKIEPYHAKLDIPDGAKLLIVTGYHHLEKPYGRIFEKMFKEQAKFDPDKIVFLNIKNGDVLTGEESYRSNREIQEAMRQHGITHIIDVHEQVTNHKRYIAHNTPGMPVKWGEKYSRSANAGVAFEYTLDAFIPTHHIELAQQGVIAPPFQHAINQDIKEIELLVKDIKRTQAVSSDKPFDGKRESWSKDSGTGGSLRNPSKDNNIQ